MKVVERSLINEDEVAALVIGCKNGDPNAFECLYKCMSQSLKSCALNITRNEALASEILQDSFVQIWQSAHSYDLSKGKAVSWLRTIVKNKAIDKCRSESKHNRARIHDDSHLFIDLSTPEAYEPDSRLSQIQMSQFIQTKLMSLPSHQRASLSMTYFYGYSRLELAEAMDTNVNTLKSWIRRGLNAIERQELQSSWII